MLPVSVKALTGNITISCTPSEVKAGSNVSCTVRGSSSDNITQVEATINVSTGFTIGETLTPLDSWEGTSLSHNKIEVYREDEVTGNFGIGTFTVSLGNDVAVGSYVIELKDVVFYAGKEEGMVSSANAAITVYTDAEAPKLSNLTVTAGGNLNKAFSNNDDSYILTLDSATTTKFSINAVPEKAEYTVTATNTDSGESINLGSEITFNASDNSTMSITITVNANGSVKNYYIIVKRPKPQEVGDATLASLIIGGVDINLVSGKFDYEVTLKDDVLNSYVIDATVSDDTNFKISNASLLKPNTLSGEVEVELIVVPKDSNTGYGSNTYIIRISGYSSPSSAIAPTPSGGGGGNSGNVPHNPQTGNSAIVVALILVISFAASLYYYKRNIDNYN